MAEVSSASSSSAASVAAKPVSSGARASARGGTAPPPTATASAGGGASAAAAAAAVHSSTAAALSTVSALPITAAAATSSSLSTSSSSSSSSSSSPSAPPVSRVAASGTAASAASTAAAAATQFGGVVYPPPFRSEVVCFRYNAVGGCRFGDKCRYVHGDSKSTPNSQAENAPPPATTAAPPPVAAAPPAASSIATNPIPHAHAHAHAHAHPPPPNAGALQPVSMMCRYFGIGGGCVRGDSCMFVHDRTLTHLTTAPPATQPTTAASAVAIPMTYANANAAAAAYSYYNNQMLNAHYYMSAAAAAAGSAADGDGASTESEDGNGGGTGGGSGSGSGRRRNKSKKPPHQTAQRMHSPQRSRREGVAAPQQPASGVRTYAAAATPAAAATATPSPVPTPLSTPDTRPKRQAKESKSNSSTPKSKAHPNAVAAAAADPTIITVPPRTANDVTRYRECEFPLQCREASHRLHFHAEPTHRSAPAPVRRALINHALAGVQALASLVETYLGSSAYIVAVSYSTAKVFAHVSECEPIPTNGAAATTVPPPASAPALIPDSDYRLIDTYRLPFANLADLMRPLTSSSSGYTALMVPAEAEPDPAANPAAAASNGSGWTFCLWKPGAAGARLSAERFPTCGYTACEEWSRAFRSSAPKPWIVPVTAAPLSISISTPALTLAGSVDFAVLSKHSKYIDCRLWSIQSPQTDAAPATAGADSAPTLQARGAARVVSVNGSISRVQVSSVFAASGGRHMIRFAGGGYPSVNDSISRVQVSSVFAASGGRHMIRFADGDYPNSAWTMQVDANDPGTTFDALADTTPAFVQTIPSVALESPRDLLYTIWCPYDPSILLAISLRGITQYRFATPTDGAASRSITTTFTQFELCATPNAFRSRGCFLPPAPIPVPASASPSAARLKAVPQLWFVLAIGERRIGWYDVYANRMEPRRSWRTAGNVDERVADSFSVSALAGKCLMTASPNSNAGLIWDYSDVETRGGSAVRLVTKIGPLQRDHTISTFLP